MAEAKKVVKAAKGCTVENCSGNALVFNELNVKAGKTLILSKDNLEDELLMAKIKRATDLSLVKVS